MSTSSPINWDHLWRHVEHQFRCDLDSIHGPAHWRRVEQAGMCVAERSGASLVVVRLFAVLHDSQRENDGSDSRHGARAAAYARRLRGQWFDLSDPEFAALEYACLWHTHGQTSEDPVIGSCWDADRLDLGRVGVHPSAKYMSTAVGREIARIGGLDSFLNREGSTDR